jgi:hypothetical protein
MRAGVIRRPGSTHALPVLSERDRAGAFCVPHSVGVSRIRARAPPTARAYGAAPYGRASGNRSTTTSGWLPPKQRGRFDLSKSSSRWKHWRRAPLANKEVNNKQQQIRKSLSCESVRLLCGVRLAMLAPGIGKETTPLVAGARRRLSSDIAGLHFVRLLASVHIILFHYYPPAAGLPYVRTASGVGNTNQRALELSTHTDARFRVRSSSELLYSLGSVVYACRA